MIEFLANLVSPIFVPMGVSYADLLKYLNDMGSYLLAGGIALVILIVVMILAKFLKKGWRAFARWQAVIAFLAAVVLLVNAACYGPLSGPLSAFLNASKVELADDVVAQSLSTIQRLGEEGFVLLKNDENTLPLSAATKKLNVFGWASTQPYLGGTGSSASSAAAATDIMKSLHDAGFETNDALTGLYTSYASARPTADMFGQNLTLPEPTADVYTDELMEQAKAFSDTAVIVIARGGGENYDLPQDMHAVIHGEYNRASEVSVNPDVYPYTKVTYQNNGDYDDFDAGESYLQLSNTEENMIARVCERFDHVILVVNSCNPMELGFLNDRPQIGAVVLAPAPGVQGFAALGEILSGAVNPSGRTADTWVYDLLNTPTLYNTGINAYTNVDELKNAILAKDATYQGSMSFVNYAEGIYVGYKFYETAALEGLIDYEKTVQYPFGYGLSYTTFEQTIDSFVDNGDSVVLAVSVKNTGNVAGKDVVELYFTPPYANGGIEKASVNLIDFEKTDIIQPGKTQKVYLTVKKEDMASYDEGLKVSGGGYILEAGEYVLSVRADSHLTLDSRSFTVASDIFYNETARSTDITAAVNRLQDESRGDFVQLSRANGFANYQEACGQPMTDDDLLMDDETLAAVQKMVFGYYDASSYDDPADEKPTQGAKNGLTLADMAGLDYADEKWDALLDQLSFKDMQTLVNRGGWQTVEIKSVGKAATSDCDGPAGLNNFITGAYGTTYPSEVLMAQTWNKALLGQVGESMGSEFAAAKNYGWYGPAMNLHRSAFGGRNFEYYSEDGVLSGLLASCEANGAAKYGVYPYLKHFALNDQELGRTAILLTYAGEQTIRENYLKPFELTVKNFTGSALAVMTSYNWIGTTPACANEELINGILRGEWGFVGLVQSDYDGSYGFMMTDAVLRAGGDLMLGYGSYDTNELNKKSATVAVALRRASKNILYTVVNSGYYAGEATVDPVNHMDELFGLINKTAACALAALEALIIIAQILNRKKRTRKNTAA